jgi:Caspase domain
MAKIAIHNYVRNLQEFVVRFVLSSISLLVASGCVGIHYGDTIHAQDLTLTDKPEVTVKVLGNGGEWRSSGVKLKKDAKYKITAEGKWSAGPLCGVTGPDGPVGLALCCVTTYMGSGCSSVLIGKIGEDGQAFVVGSSLELTTDRDDILFFRINDAPLWTGDNTGFVNVTTALVNPPKEQMAKNLPDILSHSPNSYVKSDVDEYPTLKPTLNKKAYAIVIGIEQYRQKLPKADFAVSDANLMSEYLSRVMGYPEENVVTLTNDHATYVDFVKYFEKWLPNNVEQGSTVFIFYSGHGAPNTKTGDAYIVPYDGDPSFIEQTGYSLKRMYDALGKLPAKQIIVALDSCFSGAGGRSVLAKGARPLVMNFQNTIAQSANITVMAASSGDQTSSTYDEKGHGLFTYYFLKGIKNEDVVRQDGSLAISDLFGYVKPQVERMARKQYNNEQTPQLIEPK